MTIKDKMKEKGNGIYTITISELVYVGSYGMMGYTKYTKFNLILTDNDIYSQKISEIASYDKSTEIEILDKFKKIELVNNLLKLDYEDKCVYKFNYKTLKGDDYKC